MQQAPDKIKEIITTPFDVVAMTVYMLKSEPPSLAVCAIQMRDGRVHRILTENKNYCNDYDTMVLASAVLRRKFELVMLNGQAVFALMPGISGNTDTAKAAIKLPCRKFTQVWAHGKPGLTAVLGIAYEAIKF